jgi:hypothetical protein
VNAAPYLYQLPQDLRVYNRLLGAFGIKVTFTPRDYIEVLRQMAVNSTSLLETGSLSSTQEIKRQGQGSQASLQPLSDAKIDLAVALVTLLSAEGGIDANVHTIYAPDSSGCLIHSTELVNDDVPWLSGPEYASTRTGCRMIHPNVSSLVAQKLGVKSLRLTLVSRNLEQNIFASTGSVNDEVVAFGQVTTSPTNSYLNLNLFTSLIESPLTIIINHHYSPRLNPSLLD